MQDPLAVYSYRLDPENVITRVSENWDAFARENDGAAYLSEKIIGRPLWKFIRDSDIRSLFESLLYRVRTTAAELRLPLNCDSPDCRRSLELQMRLLPDGSVELSNLVLAVVHRAVAVPLLDSSLERSDDIVRMCSWCKKIVVDQAWIDVERAIIDLGLFNTQPLPGITHGICPACYEVCMRGE